MTALARKLQSRGNEVVFIGVPDVEPFAHAAGAVWPICFPATGKLHDGLIWEPYDYQHLQEHAQLPGVPRRHEHVPLGEAAGGRQPS